MGALPYGDYTGRQVSQRVAAPVATLAALKTMSAAQRANGMTAVVVEDGSVWRFHATSALAGDDILVAAPSVGSGAWLRALGAAKLTMPIAFGTADAAVLLTIPAGCIVSMDEPFWTVSTSFSGGTSSAVGVSSTKTGFTTKGDILGGATGDVAATLVSTGAIAKMGTIGAGFDTLAKRRVLWLPAEILRFDRITSAFTAGVGAVCMKAVILQHNGA